MAPHEISQGQQSRNGTPAIAPGHIIGGIFGVVFVIANSASMPQALRVIIVVAAIGVLALTMFSFGRTVRLGLTSRPANGEEGFTRGYWTVVVVEVLTLVAGIVLLNMWRPAAIVGWIALIVGLHFFVLARLWKSGFTEITIIGAGLSILGVIGLLIAFTSDSLDAAALVSGAGSGVVLLVSALTSAIKGLAVPRTKP
ncbi:hypothetical protein [Pseudarthrobacter sp. N5]|uniref:hypothetical protein n=1 Tax=Pseudarthrobacter sp. N5 TaxID=3418416 RepID=UPI003CF07A8B